MHYQYIKDRYGAIFYPGDRGEHSVTKNGGTVLQPDRGRLHYVNVSFGPDGIGLCHPTELKIIARGKAWENAQADEIDVGK